MALFDDDGVPISDHIWKNQPGERAWPTSRQSAICTVEDRLIAFAQEEYLKPYIQIHDERWAFFFFPRLSFCNPGLMLACSFGFAG